MRHNIEYPLVGQVNRALFLPLPRTVRRIEALHFMSEYEHEPSCNPIILELAKIDFNILQHLHLKELKALSEYATSSFTFNETDHLVHVRRTQKKGVAIFIIKYAQCQRLSYSSICA